jgi:WD40 repeat protein
VVTANRDDGAHLWRWDARTGKRLGKIFSFRAVFFVVLSPDRKTVAVGQQFLGEGAEVQLWDLTTRKMVGHTARSENWPDRAAFSPDGTKLLVGYRRQAELLNVAGVKRIAELPLEHGGVASTTCLVFSSDGKVAVTANNLGFARLWDAATGKPLGKPLKEGRGIASVAFQPDGKALLAGTHDGSTWLWYVPPGKLAGQPLLPATSWVGGLAYSPDGKIILTAGLDQTVRLWDAASGQPLGVPLRHTTAVSAFAFTPDGRGLWTGGSDGSVRLWQLPRHRDLVHELIGHRGFAPVVAYSPEGKSLLTAGYDGTARVWEVATGRLKGKILDHGEGNVFAAAFSPDGKRILTAFEPRTQKPPAETRLWDVRTGKLVSGPLKHDRPIWAVAFAPDGKSFLTGGERPRLWDPATGRPLCDPLPHDGIASAVAFSRDGKMFLTASMWGVTTLNNRVVMLWQTATAKPVGRPLRHDQPVIAASFSADGRTVLTATGGSGGGQAHLWDVATGWRLGRSFRCWTGPSSAVLSPDGKKLMTLQVEDGVRLWDAATRKPIGEPLRQQARSKGIGKPLFSPDGRMILTQAGFEAQLWHATSLKPIGRPIQLEKDWDARFCSLVFGPDGRTFLTSGFDKVPRLWRVPAPLEGEAERIRLGIELTTGQELDAGGAVVGLDARTWRQRWQRLQKLGGPP